MQRGNVARALLFLCQFFFHSLPSSGPVFHRNISTQDFFFVGERRKEEEEKKLYGSGNTKCCIHPTTPVQHSPFSFHHMYKYIYIYILFSFLFVSFGFHPTTTSARPRPFYLRSRHSTHSTFASCVSNLVF